jgi:hypothetical protein
LLRQRQLQGIHLISLPLLILVPDDRFSSKTL